MEKNIDNQISELSKIFHEFLVFKKYLELEKRFSNLNKFSVNEISIINMLGHNDNVILKDIIDVIKVPKSTLTGLINKLEKNNLVKRVINDSDKRSYKLELTEKGMEISKEHDEFDKFVSSEMLNSLSNYEERQEFIKLFGKAVSNAKCNAKEEK
ncbi:MarR family winged helix-turn-helix transcriptional regulator [Clostridium thermobutyricum]|uniref:MarR family winged helix-turn-helix transcriptional regulator n=1 Tax=Clostridium thermobutyricum TaxID=29372 RepID=UPI003F52859C